MTPAQLAQQQADRVLSFLSEEDRTWVLADRAQREEAAAVRARGMDGLVAWGHLFVVLIAWALGAAFGFLAGSGAL